MSVQASSWAWAVRGLPSHLKLTLLAIADSCNATGFGFPGQLKLAEQLECCERQVRYNTAALIRLGLLEVTVRPGRGDGRHSNAYQLRLEVREARQVSGGVTPLARSPGVRTAQATGQARPLSGEATGNTVPGATGNVLPGATGNGGQGNRQCSVGQPAIAIASFPLVEPLVKNKDTLCAARTADERSAGASAPGFAQFWAAWPAGQRKRGRKAALAAWTALHLDPLTAMIIADVLNRRDHDEQWARGYAPMPATYLRGARWEDELAAPTARATPGHLTATLQILEDMKCQHPSAGSRPRASPACSDWPL
jgi:hypothetical protein